MVILRSGRSMTNMVNSGSRLSSSKALVAVEVLAALILSVALILAASVVEVDSVRSSRISSDVKVSPAEALEASKVLVGQLVVLASPGLLAIARTLAR